MTEKEWKVSKEQKDNYLLYIVWNLDGDPQFKKYINPYKYEFTFILQSIFSACLIVTLYFAGILNLTSYFIMHYLVSTFVIVSGWRILYANKVRVSEHMKLAKGEIIKYIKEFYIYSHPLILQALVVYIVVVIDRWLLQKYYGSLEQGFFTNA